MARKLTDIINLKLRLSEALRRRLEKAAERNDRSMNAEIIHRLETSFEPPPFDLHRALADAIEEARTKHGEDQDQILLAVSGPIRAALQQLLPELHSVQVALLNGDGTGMGARSTSYSPKGWESRHEIIQGDR
jgi:hypothetical protein